MSDASSGAWPAAASSPPVSSSNSPRASSRRKPSRATPSCPTLQREDELTAQGYKRIAGVDEAGRGPLAGPVVAAAVVLPRDWQLARFAQSSPLSQLNDSKQLTAAVRDVLYEELMQKVAYGIAAVDAAMIDRINIRQASWLAMREAVADLERRTNAPADYVLIDGLPYGVGPWPYEAIVKGDARSLSIAAASVLAKVTRDRLMQEFDAQFPLYGFAQHKGYPTPPHLRALAAYGPCAIHRQSYAPVRRVVEVRARATGSRPDAG